MKHGASVRGFVFAGIAVLLLSSGTSNGQNQADDASRPVPGDVKQLTLYPGALNFNGLDGSVQIIVTGELTERSQDFTGEANYRIDDPNVARVTSTGLVFPLTNGSTQVTATFGGKSISAPIECRNCEVTQSVNFANQVVPIFTKFGCNSGGCHGKSGGQNGFAISLLGFIPDMDYTALVKEDRGRRLLPAAPDYSLLLLKASGTLPHGGGKRLDLASDEYKLLRRWIAAGMPYGSASDPTLVSIDVFPDKRTLTRNNHQQLAVTAHYSDGSAQDVTQRAQYESNGAEVAIVDGRALVHSLDLPGEAAIMARYQGQVATFRATVPLGRKIPDYQFAPMTVVDTFTHKKWQELGIVPSDLCTDAEFLRRVSLDISGTLPSPEKVKSFLADTSADKRAKLVDALLETPEYSYLFANKWADLLRVSRQQNEPARAQGTFAFHEWIRDAIARDKPYDLFVRDILTATGDATVNPPTAWYSELTEPQQLADDASQVFLGMRVACAQCHHHPYEKWSQDDYWGLAAYFGRLGRKNNLMPSTENQQVQFQAIFNRGKGNVTNKGTGQAAKIKPLGGSEVEVAVEDDPRDKLADWMTAPANPFFAKAVANRYWAHFLGHGIVDPIDDMRVTNPPSNPELLDALAKEVVDHGYSLKHLIRVIVNSRTYQLSSAPNEFNQHDKQSFARFYPRRLTAEVLFDAVSQVTGSPGTFNGLPKDQFAPNRAIMLPDESFGSYFLDVFGRPKRISACECERVTGASLAQSLHLLNSQEVQDKLTRQNGRADVIAKEKRADVEKIEELFLVAFGRPPTVENVAVATAHLERNPTNKKAAYENLIWALVNTKEFMFNH